MFGLHTKNAIKVVMVLVIRRLVLAFQLLVITWMCFGPIAGWHHMYSFGVSGYLFLDGDTPAYDHFIWKYSSVHFSPLCFSVSLVLWCLVTLNLVNVNELLPQTIVTFITKTCHLKGIIGIGGIVIGIVLLVIWNPLLTLYGPFIAVLWGGMLGVAKFIELGQNAWRDSSNGNLPAPQHLKGIRGAIAGGFLTGFVLLALYIPLSIPFAILRAASSPTMIGEVIGGLFIMTYGIIRGYSVGTVIPSPRQHDRKEKKKDL